MLARTNNTTLLLLVPDTEKDAIRVVSNTSIIDAETGAELKGLSTQDLLERATKVLHEQGMKGTWWQRDDWNKFVASVLGSVSLNDRAEFDKLLKERNANIIYPDVLWSELLKVRLASPYAFATVGLPQREHTPFIPDQVPVIVDNKKMATATLVGTNELRRDKWYAVLSSEGGDNLPATAISIDDDKNTMNLQFPSTSLLKIKPTTLTISQIGKPNKTVFSKSVTVNDASATAVPGFALSASSSLVLASAAGEGQIQFAVSKAKKTEATSVQFLIKGAVVTESPAGAITDKGGWKVDKDALITVKLTGLVPNTPVSLVAKDDKDADLPSISWLVVPAEKVKK